MQFSNFSYNLDVNNIECIEHPNEKLSIKLEFYAIKADVLAKNAIKILGGQELADSIMSTYRRSNISKKLIVDNLYKDNKKGVPRSSKSSYKKALNLLFTKLTKNEPLRIVPFEGIKMYEFNKQSSAELPYCNDKDFKNYINKKFFLGLIDSGRYTKVNGLDYILKHEEIKFQRIFNNNTNFSDLMNDFRIHTRPKLVSVDEHDKMRIIFGVPCTIFFAEIMLLWPLMARIKSLENPFIAWGYETYCGGLERLRQEVTSYDHHLSLDFCDFDKFIPFWMIDDIHEIFYKLYDNGTYSLQNDTICDSKSYNLNEIKNLWKFMNFSVKNAVYRAPDGSRHIRNHSGLPSGLFQTQLLGSCCSFVMISAALIEYGFDEHDFSIKVLGDDSCVSLKKCVDKTKLMNFIVKYCSENFNMIINIEKSIFNSGTEHLQFLSYKFEKGKVVRVKKDLLGKLLYPDNSKANLEQLKCRAYGILTANLGSDLLVHEVCSYIIRELKNHSMSTFGTNLFFKKRLDFFLNSFDDLPTPGELAKIALTPQETLQDEVFNSSFK